MLRDKGCDIGKEEDVSGILITNRVTLLIPKLSLK